MGWDCFIDNLNMGLGLFKPVLSKRLPSFTTAKITADAAGFHDGGAEILELTAQGIEVDLNLGGPIIKGAGALLRNATIDFKASFPASDSPTKPEGFEVQTGTTSDSIFLDFQDELIRAEVAVATVQISEFVYITGSLAFEKGAVKTVDVTGGFLTGITGGLVDAVLGPLDLTPSPGRFHSRHGRGEGGIVLHDHRCSGRACLRRHRRTLLDGG